MRENEKILAVIDPNAHEQPALERGVRLAEAFGAGVELFICDYDQYLAGGRLFDSRSLEKARESLLRNHTARLEKLAAPLRDRGLTVSVDARWGRPLDRGIVRKVLESQPLLLVKDSHYHDTLKRTVLSNTDWNLIRSCPVPLLLVKPRQTAQPPTVLAAVDPVHEHDKPAELDRAILSFATELTSALQGELHVLHTFDTAPILAAAADTPIATMAAPSGGLTAGIERAHRDALNALLADFSVKPDNVHLKEGVAHELLARMAQQQHVDFVVMGAVSRSGLKRVFVGSTAERVLDRLPCDLVIVKPPGFLAPDVD